MPRQLQTSPNQAALGPSDDARSADSQNPLEFDSGYIRRLGENDPGTVRNFVNYFWPRTRMRLRRRIQDMSLAEELTCDTLSRVLLVIQNHSPLMPVPYQLEEYVNSVCDVVIVERNSLDRHSVRSKLQSEIVVHETATADDELRQKLRAHLAGLRIPVAQITALASSVFEDKDKAEKWLAEANPATDDRAPIELLGNPKGFERVKNVLLRIEHGVLA